MGLSGPAVVIITASRLIIQILVGRTMTAGGEVNQKYTHDQVINVRTKKGNGGGAPDNTATRSNKDMMAESSDLTAIYWHLLESDPISTLDERHLPYNCDRKSVMAFCEVVRWRNSEDPCDNFQNTDTIASRQSHLRGNPLDSMETRGKLKQADSRRKTREENRSQEGRVWMQEDPPFTVWEIEDNSEEDRVPKSASVGERHPKTVEAGGQVQNQMEQRKTRHHGMRKPCSPRRDTEEPPKDDLGFRGVSSRRSPQKTPMDRTKQQVKTEMPEHQNAGCRRSDRRKHSIPFDNEGTQSGKRGKGQNVPVKEEGEPSRRTGKGRKPRETVNRRVRRAEQAFIHHSHPGVRRIMDFLEEEALQNHSDEEMGDLEFLLHDPGHTRGRMSLIKQSLHIYWVMKGLLAKALEHVAKEMVELALGDQKIRGELSYLRIAMTKQEEQLDYIQKLLERDPPESEQAADKRDAGDNE